MRPRTPNWDPNVLGSGVSSGDKLLATTVFHRDLTTFVFYMLGFCRKCRFTVGEGERLWGNVNCAGIPDPLLVRGFFLLSYLLHFPHSSILPQTRTRCQGESHEGGLKAQRALNNRSPFLWWQNCPCSGSFPTSLWAPKAVKPCAPLSLAWWHLPWTKSLSDLQSPGWLGTCRTSLSSLSPWHQLCLSFPN